MRGVCFWVPEAGRGLGIGESVNKCLLSACMKEFTNESRGKRQAFSEDCLWIASPQIMTQKLIIDFGS